jgi:hypothetical protein
MVSAMGYGSDKEIRENQEEIDEQEQKDSKLPENPDGDIDPFDGE